MTALDTSQPSPSARIDQDDLERFSISDTASTRWRDRDTPSSESIIVIDQSRSEGRESQHSISNSSFSKTKLHSIQPPRLKGLKEFWKSWGLEIGALALSIGSTLTITAVLFSWDTQPLTDWHFVTSLNTVISTLGAIARISLAFAISACIGQQKWNWFRIRQDRLKTFERFDEASRGPWGSFILLCTLWKR
jgi:hypothetical protein